VAFPYVKEYFKAFSRVPKIYNLFKKNEIKIDFNGD